MSERLIETHTPLDPYAEATSVTSTSRFRITPFMVIVVLAVVFFLGVVGYGIYKNQLTTVKAGDEAPDFSLALYDTINIPYAQAGVGMDLSGETFKLSDFRGEQVVVLNFWQTNCIPCHQEAPMLVQVYNDYRDQGVVLLGVNVKDPDRVAFDYLAQYGIVYPNGLDRRDHIQDEYRTTGQPETFVIDRNGIILQHFVGPPTENQLRDAIDRALQS